MTINFYIDPGHFLNRKWIVVLVKTNYFSPLKNRLQFAEAGFLFTSFTAKKNLVIF